MLTHPITATTVAKIRQPTWRATRPRILRALIWLSVVGALAANGCGTTRWTNSPRTGTELLLISDAIDRSVDRMDFRAMADESVFLDSQYLRGTIDEGYIVSSLRQKLLASGCALTEERAKAQFIVEARSGGVGTDQTDLVFGVPSVNIPPILGSVGGVPPSIPEIPLIKKTAQKAVAKLAVFAYERANGRAVWQSGATPVGSVAKATYIFGAGPFQQGTIYERPKFAGRNLPILQTLSAAGHSREDDDGNSLSVTSHAVFLDQDPQSNQVQLAGHDEPVPGASSKDEASSAPATTAK